MNNTISIITPTYNRAFLISRMIYSVFNQSYKDWELIIVDDGSTDNTAEMIEPFLNDPRIKYFKKENTGAGDSRNYGIGFSRGEWLIFLDSDDTFDPDKLKTHIEYIKKYGENKCYYTGFRRVDNDRDEIIREINSIPVSNMNEELKNFNPIKALSTVIFPAKVVKMVGGFDPDFKARQDVDLYYRISKVQDFVHIPEILVNVYTNITGRISQNYDNRLEGFKLFLKKHGKDMTKLQRSFLAKRIFLFALKNNSIKDAICFFPLSVRSIIRY